MSDMVFLVARVNLQCAFVAISSCLSCCARCFEAVHAFLEKIRLETERNIFGTDTLYGTGQRGRVVEN